MRFSTGFSRQTAAVALLLVATALFGASCNHFGPSDRTSSQLAFGVDMARRGLWNEALFRFREAERGDPQNPRVQNNLGVAFEAQGQFDQALEHYKKALQFAPEDRQVRANYTRFVEFYQGFKSTADRTSLANQFGKGKGKGKATAGSPPPPQAAPTPPPAPAYNAPSSSSSSSAPAYGDDYGHKKYAAPPFWVRWHSKWDKLKAKISGGIKCLAAEFHEHWKNLKSDADRVKDWGSCKIEHFNHWLKYKKEVAAGKRKIRSELERKYYQTLCKFEKECKDEYQKREKECEGKKDEYTEEDDDYNTTSTVEEYKMEPCQGDACKIAEKKY